MTGRKYDHIKPGFVPRTKVAKPYESKKRKPASAPTAVIKVKPKPKFKPGTNGFIESLDI